MKRKFYFIAIVTAVTLLNTGCPPAGHVGGIKSIDMLIRVTDLSGNDMFDTTNANAYDLDSIRLFRKNPTTGEVELVYNKWADCPYGYDFSFDKKPYLISVFLADDFSTPRTTTYIHWTPTDIDTVDATFVEGFNYFVVDEVFINGKQVAEKYSKRPSNRVFVHLVKDR